jgi:hypothetical protein
VAGVVERAAPEALLLEVVADDAGAVVPVVKALVAARPAMPVFVHHATGSLPDLPVAANLHRVRTLTGALHEVLATVRLHPPTA